MQDPGPTNQNPAETEYSSGAGCLTRLYWMFFGNAVLALLFVWLILNHPAFPSLHDAGYLLTVASLAAVRYADIRYYKGETGAAGTPATMDDWKKYSRLLFAGSVSAWLVVRILIPLFAAKP